MSTVAQEELLPIDRFDFRTMRQRFGECHVGKPPIFRRSFDGNSRKLARNCRGPIFSHLLTPSAGALAPSFDFAVGNRGRFCKISPTVNGLRLSLPLYGEQAGAIYTDFTGTRRKSRVSCQGTPWGTFGTVCESLQLGRRSPGYPNGSVDSFAPFFWRTDERLAKGRFYNPGFRAAI